MNDKIVASIAEYLKEEEAKLLDPEQVCKFGEDPASGWWPDFDEMDKLLLTAIYHDPTEAMEHGLLFKVVDLLSYGNGTPREGSVMEIAKDWAYTSRYGHLGQRTHNRFVLLPTTTIVALNKPDHPYTGWAINGIDTFKTDAERAKGAILLHTILGHIPGLELVRVWSKVFDAERNKRDNGYHSYKDGCDCWVNKDGFVKRAVRQFGQHGKAYPVNHFVDHPYGNTDTLQPGFRATLQVRTMLPDVNDFNKHPAHAIGDFLLWDDFKGFQPTEMLLPDDFIKAGWVHMMKQALAIQPVDGFHLEDTSRWCLALSK